MKMIIGGAYQGKLAYAKKQNPYIHWTDGELCEGDNIFEAEGVFHFEKYIQSMIKKKTGRKKKQLFRIETNKKVSGYCNCDTGDRLWSGSGRRI